MCRPDDGKQARVASAEEQQLLADIGLDFDPDEQPEAPPTGVQEDPEAVGSPAGQDQQADPHGHHTKIEHVEPSVQQEADPRLEAIAQQEPTSHPEAEGGQQQELQSDAENDEIQPNVPSSTKPRHTKQEAVRDTKNAHIGRSRPNLLPGKCGASSSTPQQPNDDQPAAEAGPQEQAKKPQLHALLSQEDTSDNAKMELQARAGTTSQGLDGPAGSTLQHPHAAVSPSGQQTPSSAGPGCRNTSTRAGPSPEQIETATDGFAVGMEATALLPVNTQTSSNDEVEVITKLMSSINHCKDPRRPSTSPSKNPQEAVQRISNGDGSVIGDTQRQHGDYLQTGDIEEGDPSTPPQKEASASSNLPASLAQGNYERLGSEIVEQGPAGASRQLFSLPSPPSLPPPHLIRPRNANVSNAETQNTPPNSPQLRISFQLAPPDQVDEQDSIEGLQTPVLKPGNFISPRSFDGELRLDFSEEDEEKESENTDTCKPQEHQKKDDDDDDDSERIKTPIAPTHITGKTRKLSPPKEEQPRKRRPCKDSDMDTIEDGEILENWPRCGSCLPQQTIKEYANDPVTDEKKVPELIPSKTPDRPRDFISPPGNPPVSRLEFPENLPQEPTPLSSGRRFRRTNMPPEYVPQQFDDTDVSEDTDSEDSEEDNLTDDSESGGETDSSTDDSEAGGETDSSTDDSESEDEEPGSTTGQEEVDHASSEAIPAAMNEQRNSKKLQKRTKPIQTSNSEQGRLARSPTPIPPRLRFEALEIARRSRVQKREKEGRESPEIVAWTESPRVPKRRNYGDLQVIRAQEILIYPASTAPTSRLPVPGRLDRRSVQFRPPPNAAMLWNGNRRYVGRHINARTAPEAMEQFRVWRRNAPERLNLRRSADVTALLNARRISDALERRNAERDSGPTEHFHGREQSRP